MSDLSLPAFRQEAQMQGPHRVAWRLLTLSYILLGASVNSQPALTDVDQIIALHIEAIGGYDNIKAIRSLVHSNGQYEEADYKSEGDAWMARMRPYYRVVGNPEEPGFPDGFMEGYDGSAWEWYGDPGIVLRTVGPAAAASRHGAHVEYAISPLIDYEKKSTTVTIGELAMIDGQPAYKLFITVVDGTSTEVFVDRSSFLVVSVRRSAPIHAFGDPVTSESRPTEYRRVAGVLIPHRNVESEIQTGKILNQMRWGSIEANVEMPASWFSPPVFSRTRVQQLIEHIYGERSDIDAVLWTYFEFRREYPHINTRAAIEVVGYQMLKMGDVDQAIRLLETNAADHPKSASSAFGVGRAYVTATKLDKAREVLRHSLTLDPKYERSLRLLQEIEGR